MGNQSKIVLVPGGGIHSIVTATRLLKRLPTEHRVVLIEREENHVLAPLNSLLIAGQEPVSEIHQLHFQ